MHVGWSFYLYELRFSISANYLLLQLRFSTSAIYALSADSFSFVSELNLYKYPVRGPVNGTLSTVLAEADWAVARGIAFDKSMELSCSKAVSC